MGKYHPSKADLAYRDAAKGKVDLFNRARLLREVSHEYLAVLAHDNATVTRSAIAAMINAEISRRGFAAARRANFIALGSAGIALISLLLSLR